MVARRLIPAVALCAAVAALLCGAPAHAAVTHHLLYQIKGTSSEAFKRACGVAVDPATQDVYVADTESDAIDIFNSSGAYQSQISGMSVPLGHFSNNICSFAVSGKTGDVYVADSRADVVYVFNALGAYLTTMTGEGTPKGSFGRYSVYVTVDQASGDIYVGNNYYGGIDKFGPEGAYLSEISVGGLGGRGNLIALTSDASGDIYVTIDSGDGVRELDPAGTEVLHLASESGASTVATDSAGHIYVVTNAGIKEYDSSGNYLGQVAVSAFAQKPEGISVNVEGDLYVADGSAVDVLGPELTVPTTTVQAPSELVETAATLNGSVNPSGAPVTSCELEYGTTTAYGKSVACEPEAGSIGAGTSPVAVRAPVSGLQPNTTYHFRLVAGSPNGSETSEDTTFTTPGPPAVDSESAAIPIGQTRHTGVTLDGQITADGRETTYRFEYGETESYGKSAPVPPGVLAAGEQPVSVPAAEVSGLKVDATYHYRLVASNEYGTTYGADQTFATLAGAEISEEASRDVTASSASLGALIDPLENPTEYHFEYLTEAAYQANLAARREGFQGAAVAPSPDGSVGSVEEGHPVSETIQGLEAGTSYRYRVVAHNHCNPLASGETCEVDGPALTFMTQAALANSEFVLPDGRQWEMVSPPNKYGAEINQPGWLGASVERAASDGEAIAYPTIAGPEPDSQGNGRMSQFLSRRTPTGWTTANIAIPHGGPTDTFLPGQDYVFFSENLERAVVEPHGSFSRFISPQATEQTLFLREDFSGGNVDDPCTAECFLPLVSAANVPAGTVFGQQHPEAEQGRGPEFMGATADTSHTVLRSEVALTGTPLPGGDKALYEWSDGRLTLVSVLPQSREQREKGEESLAYGPTFGGSPGQSGGGHYSGSDGMGAISADGSRVVFTASAKSGASAGLFLRDLLQERTVESRRARSGVRALRRRR